MWEATHHFIVGSILIFIAFKKKSKTQIFYFIFLLKQSEEQNFSSPILGKIVQRFG